MMNRDDHNITMVSLIAGGIIGAGVVAWMLFGKKCCSHSKKSCCSGGGHHHIGHIAEHLTEKFKK
ncbi:hypothetical protein [Aureibacter tunicatorum]|uniref:Uncharacterized protein n=1 Tax=Aureibacter tunicatorum TaxID=866807 RepID=A0AAE4BT71_9BACT|nr:hypothetical protein [Aureibacter tunicatorum]MDR6239650.1 hypothetical protein [Aureibacter tunicatorum]BDD04126.1 hypothetical protein AUTU_16090 [Aureibacter tunicatorum]